MKYRCIGFVNCNGSDHPIHEEGENIFVICRDELHGLEHCKSCPRFKKIVGVLGEVG
ncbi:hypothetical protein ES706_02399 [subsurface metagenome]